MNEMLATRMNDMFVGTYWSARQESREQAARRVAGFLRAISSTADGVLSEWFHTERTHRAASQVRIDSTPEGVEPYLRVNRRDLDREVMPELGFSFDVWNGRDVSFRVTVGAYSPHVGNAAVLSFQGPIQLGDADWRKLLDAAIEAFDPEHGVVTSLAELARAGVAHSQVRCMTKQLLFFATKEDLRPLLAAVEGVVPIDYVLMGIYPAEVAEKYGSIEDIPNLGHATSDSAINSREFLVVKKNCTVNMESVATVHGKRYVIDQLLNPNSVTFAPGGLWGSDVLLNGRFATVHNDEGSQALMKQFAKILRKSFRKLKAYWVGPEAERLLEAGKRLTIAAQTPREFDLTKN
jgi:hypothetical protein